MPSLKKAVIPVAGLGTRFLPMTKAQPKEMLPLVDKPVIQYVVEEAARSHFEEFILITSEGKRSIENHFTPFPELEMLLNEKNKQEDIAQLHWINALGHFTFVQQPKALGLGHAVLCAQEAVGNESFALLLGDDVFDPHDDSLDALLKAHQVTGKSIVGVQEVPREHVDRYGIVNAPFPNKAPFWSVNQIIEKPARESALSQWAVVGRYILTPEIFRFLECTRPSVGGEIQLTSALESMAQQGDLIACAIPAQRFDTGNKLDYVKASIEFALKHPEIGAEVKKYLQLIRP